jgi:membrane fusion protein, heavy metal efflux system
MSPDERAGTPLGRAYLWGGVGLGALLVLLLLTKGFGLFGGAGGPEQQPVFVHKGDKIFVPEDSLLRKELKVEPARAQPVSPLLSLPAVVESDPSRTAAVLTPLGGRVIKLAVALGDRVQRGQELAVIDSPDYGQAISDNKKAADAYALVAKNYERQAAQFQIGAISAHDLDQARSDRAQAAAEYARTQARLKAVAPLAQPGSPSQLLVVRAPVSGSITTMTIAIGNMINDPTQPIMTVADLSTIWVTAMVPEKDLSQVSREQEADVRLDAYPNRVLHGKVLFVSDVVEPDTRRNKVRIAFSNPDYTLKPNMFGTAVVSIGVNPRVVVPASALLMNNDRTSVFVETTPWTFERRFVEPLLEEGPNVAIRSGITPGERVVVSGGILLND